jgi:hypothetical protein
MKKTIGYPKTKELLQALHYAPSIILIRDFKLLSHIEREDGVFTKRRHPLIVGLVVYPIYLWEKHHNLH